MSLRRTLPELLLILVSLRAAASCGNAEPARPAEVAEQAGSGGTSLAGASGGGAPAVTPVGGSGINVGGIGTGGATSGERGPLPSCPGCTWVGCASGATTISGTVRTPALTNADPLYNAVVYIPASDVTPFTPGVSCDRCGNVSGDPVAAALSGTDGKFVLENVPAGTDVPLVVQLGRWRRQVRIPEVKSCQDNPLPEELTRFPRNRTEGDIPQIAIATSPYDPEECILRKIGLDDAEFTAPTGAGRVHLFRAGGATLAGEIPDAATLWGDAAVLGRYDMVLLPCGAVQGGIGGSPVASAAQAARRRLAEYADAGGRVFTTDLSYSWLTGESSPFIDTATWIADPSVDEPISPLASQVDTTFPKGQALAEWLLSTGATTVLGEIALNETYRRSLSVNPPSQRWLHSDTPASLQAFTFNTPLDVAPGAQCGRVFYSSFHIAGATFNSITFPESCDTAPLTPQERVLEFMLFDLASCVQIDEAPPLPPPVVVK